MSTRTLPLRLLLGSVTLVAALYGCSVDKSSTDDGVSSNAPIGAGTMQGAGSGAPPNGMSMGSDPGAQPGENGEGPPGVGLAPTMAMNADGSCALGRTGCSGSCVDTAADGQNCGGCGSVCPAGRACSAGQCAASCVSGLSVCDGSCVDTSGSPEHCGSCGQACPADQTCWLGSCRCPTGQDACEGGVCGDVLQNLQHCGSCGNVCPAAAACVGGSCVCPEFGIDCGGTCRAVLSDETNCGTCGTACGGGTECLFGGCVDPDSVDCGGNSAQNQRTCVRDATIELGRAWVNNNQWGIDATVSGEQCIWSTCRNGDLVGWGTDWDWQGGSQFQVKSFVSLVQGWNWGNRIENTGLPLQIGSTQALNCGWNFSIETNGTLSVTFDLFLHTIADPDYQTDPTDEVMIWPYRANGAGPLGTQQATVNLAGTTWTLFRGTHPVWANVFSYVRTQNTTTAVINVMDFMRDLVNRGMVEPSKYISTIQTGTEIFTGSGSLQTHGYFCRVGN